jgi:hypothetical protein
MYYLTRNAARSGDWMLPNIIIEGSGYVLCMLCTAVYCIVSLLKPCDRQNACII